MNPDRVGFFLPSLVGGGAERVMVNIARGMTARGLAVDLVLGQARGPYLQQVPREARVVDLRARRALTSLPGLVRYLRRERPQVLVSSLSHTNVVALWARRMARVGTRLFVTVHNTESDAVRRTPIARARLLPLLMRRFYPWADGIVAVSRGVAADVASITQLPLDRIHVIYNPVVTPDVFEKMRVPVDHRWFATDGAPVVLAAGRFTWEKDFPTLIEAFAQVRQRRPARLLILGEGAERPRLEAIVRQHRLEHDVDLPGFVTNPYAYMARCALFVLSSVSEGLPTALIEALATGMRVVATDCRNGPREILQGGRVGRLVPVGDAAALATAILAALERPGAAIPPEAWHPYSLDVAVDNYLRLLRVGERA